MATEKARYDFITEEVALPSEGYFYPESSPLSSGIVTVKYMTANEEDILTTRSYITRGVVFDKLLEAVLVQRDIKLDDLLLGDKNAVLISTRILGFGPLYNVTIKCPSCNAESEHEIDLREVEGKETDFSAYEKGVNRFKFTLPTSQREVEFKLLTHKDEHAINAEIDQTKKVLKNAASPEITTRLRAAIVSIDGEESREKINVFVNRQILALDSRALRDEIRRVSPDMDMRFEFVCPECSHEAKLAIIPDIHFFWPSTES